MEIACAECGCLVERGLIIKPCDEYPDCCCTDLPLGAREPAEETEPVVQSPPPASDERRIFPASLRGRVSTIS